MRYRNEVEEYRMNKFCTEIIKKKLPILSIIVPVYNVEDFLSQCIDSILAQSIQDYELILVDDGSTDTSSSICDKYAAGHSKVSVVHKKNGGLSDARNTGLKIASGKYVGFVDSDDWIVPNMYENMIKAAIDYSASIVCCNYDSYTSAVIQKQRSDKIISLKQEEAICKLFYRDHYRFFAWNKIYLKSLFDNLEYPYGKHYEDIVTTYSLFKKVDKIIYIDSSYYVYRRRVGSISNNEYSLKTKELLEAINFVYNDMFKENPNIVKRSVSGYIQYYLWFLDKAILGKDRELKQYHSYIREIIGTYLYSILTCKEITYTSKTKILLCAYTWHLYCFIITKRIKSY